MRRIILVLLAVIAAPGCTSLGDKMALVEHACQQQSITLTDSGGQPISIPVPNEACSQAVAIAGRNEALAWASALSPLAGQALALGAQVYQHDQALDAQQAMHALDTRLAHSQGRQGARLEALQIKNQAAGDRDALRAALASQRDLTGLASGLLRDDARADRALLDAVPDPVRIPIRIYDPDPEWPPGYEWQPLQPLPAE